jgi:type IV pilus assembly protein PilV
MRRAQAGFSMIEILITIAILMVGLLGLAGLQTQVAAAEFEAYQRAQALVLVQEMADRMNANKAIAAKYVMDDIGADGVEVTGCSGMTSYDRDICEFHNALVGASEKKGGVTTVGAMIGARACITSPEANVYVITLAWQGFAATKAPDEKCGAGAYGDDKKRRTVSFPVRVATLTLT